MTPIRKGREKTGVTVTRASVLRKKEVEGLKTSVEVSIKCSILFYFRFCTFLLLEKLSIKISYFNGLEKIPEDAYIIGVP